MKASDDAQFRLPPGAPSLWRTVKFGARAEPRLLYASFATVLLGALPDVLVAVWLKVLSDGVLGNHRTQIVVAAIGLAASATGTWLLRVVTERTERRFRDRVGIALESHVAELHARVATIEHQERPELVDRLAVLRDQVFALDHLFLSLFSTVGWVIRPCS
jgi:ATP-binding cassette subfamily B protein